MKILRLVCAAVIALSVLPIVGCTSTGTTSNTRTSSAVNDWVKSPQTQAELGQLQDFAFNQALKYLGGAFGNVRSKSATPAATDEQVLAKMKADAEAKFPDVPKDALDQQVAAAFARAKARKRSTGSG